MTMKLHSFAESGNAWKCALALTMADLDWSPVFVDFFAGATRTPAFRALNPMGEVPVLEDGATVLTQSGVILDYISSKNGRLGGKSAAARREVLRWLFWDNHKFSAVIGSTRFLANFLPPEKRPQPVIDFQMARLKSAYGVLDGHLANRAWVAGEEVTIADLSLCGYLYYPEPFGFDRAAWPRIDAWLDRIAALPGWQHPHDMLPRAFPAQGGPT